MRPHRRQPTRLPHPWDSPGKSTGVGCHFLLQCMKVKSESEVAQPCPTLSDPMDCSLPGSSIHGIFQARALGWAAIAFSHAALNIPIYNCEHIHISFAQFSKSDIVNSYTQFVGFFIFVLNSITTCCSNLLSQSAVVKATIK